MGCLEVGDYTKTRQNKQQKKQPQLLANASIRPTPSFIF